MLLYLIYIYIYLCTYPIIVQTVVRLYILHVYDIINYISNKSAKVAKLCGWKDSIIDIESLKLLGINSFSWVA